MENNLGHFGRDVNRWQGADPEEYWWHSDGLATQLAVRSARRTWLGYFPAVPKSPRKNNLCDSAATLGRSAAFVLATSVAVLEYGSVVAPGARDSLRD